MNEVRLHIPSSSANVGLGFDVWCLGLEKPELFVRYTKLPGRRGRIGLDVSTPLPRPEGRKLGYAGEAALRQFMQEHDIPDGAHIYLGDNGYPVGGLGRSGAEAVGAVMAAAVAYEIPLTREEIIVASAKAEPNEHKDNVAASVNGRFDIVVPQMPGTGMPSIDYCDVPESLGLAMGFSSYQKTGGTEAGRRVVRDPVDQPDFVAQTGLISAATLALATGNTERFLELAWGDRFHQPRRAHVGFYGNFSDRDFHGLQERLYADFGVAWNVSGAGPNMQAMYNKERYPQGIASAISPLVVPWFESKGIRMRLEDAVIAKGGAYDYAQRNYGYGN